MPQKHLQTGSRADGAHIHYASYYTPTNFAPTGYPPRIRQQSQVAFCNRIADLLQPVPQKLFQHKVLEQQSYKLPLTKYLCIYTGSFSGSGSAPDVATGNLYFGNSTYIAM